MQHSLALFGVFAWLGLMPNLAPAHFNILLPDKPSAKKGETVTFTYQWGHPFEHQLFDAPVPQSVFVRAPDGNISELDKILEKATEGTKPTAYHFSFTPQQRGDYIFVLKTPAIWMEESQEYLQDTVKVVLHVQAQKGWDAPALRGPRDSFEIVPLTRPYGLQPGMVFQAQAQLVEKGLPGAMVEIEPYHPEPPKELPPDEHITRIAKTDPNGVVTCTLPDWGWWCLTAQRDGGKKAREGKDYPVRQRTTLWVFVDEKLMSK